MSARIHIARDLSLPDDVVTKKLAMLGTTGSGKSYAATKLAEELFGIAAQVVAVDPVGIWYGLRLSASGKSPGLPFTIFGGLHGDVPIDPTKGALIADVICDRNISAVIDVSQLDSDTDALRFVRDFGTRLFERRKAKPKAMHIFVEECQEFLPENPQSQYERMCLHAWKRICKIGRNFGIGVSLISQRPQEVNKKALNLTECMFAFQMQGPHERKAVRAWIEDIGGDGKIVDQLPKLEVGHAHVWSPRWLKISREVAIGKKHTFDASSTPELGESKAAEVKPLSSKDLEALRKEMAEVIEKEKENDPTALKAKLAAAQRELAKGATKSAGKPAAAASNPTTVKEQYDAGYQRGVHFTIQHLGKQIRRLEEDVKKFVMLMNGHFGKGKAICDGFRLETIDTESGVTSLTKSGPPPKAPTAATPAKPEASRPAKYYNRPIATAPPTLGPGGVSKGETDILQRIVQMNGATPAQISVLVQLKRSTRNKYLQLLGSRGFISRDGEKYVATPEGVAAAGDIPELPVGHDRFQYWLTQVSAGEASILREAYEQGPDEPTDRVALGEAAGLQRSTRNKYIQILIARQLLVDAGKGKVRVSRDLFD